MRSYEKYSTPEPEALLERHRDTCPHCGRPLPAELECYTLLREGEPTVYCPQCGQEWGVTPDA